MQQIALTLAENNDETVNVAITSSGSPLNLTGATINMYLKTAAGTPDGGATLLSSAGGSPAITITNPSGGLCTVAIPRADLTAETNTFYRIDVVFSGLQNTAIYGSITWITL
jgi:BppU N-terminal domain